MRAITILITDDHVMVRQLLGALVNSDPRFCVIGECGTAEEAVIAAKTLKPGIIIMDVNLPGKNGIHACKMISDDPENSARVIGVSMNAEYEYARKMMQNGAMGYVTKNSPSPELFHAIVEVFNGGKYICSEIKDQLATERLEENRVARYKKPLSLHQIKLVDLLRQGFTSKEIAVTLCLSVKAIESQRQALLKKLRVPNVAALINYATSMFP